MKQELISAVGAICQELFEVQALVELSRPESQFGDFSTNVALQLASKTGKPPREIAETIKARLLASPNLPLQSVDVAGPGFLNLTLNGRALENLAAAEPAQNLSGKTVLVEYSDPNPFKPLHAGHLYTTLVGDCVARLVQRAGAKTVRINFGGDVGLHVGKSIWAIIKQLGGELPDELNEIPELDRAAWLGARYVEGNAAYNADETAKAEIVSCNKRVYEVQAMGDHDSPFAKIYWTCRQWSYDYFATLYLQLQVEPFDRFIPESEVTPLGLKTVQQQLKNGVYEESDGAVVFNGEQFGLHTRVFINSAGLPTYETKDVGLSLTKWQDYHYDESIIITANEQAQYMQVVIKSIEQFAPEPAKRTKHLTHGLVKLSGGVKISSRKGNGPSALDILEAARTAGQATGNNPNEETILAAVKYAFAKNRIGGDIVYDPIESIALEGNSGPYLQYAHARARSILAKAPVEAGQSSNQSEETAVDLQPDERNLLRKIGEQAEVIDRAVSELMPHHVCTYLYELAQEFNRFYEKNRVIGDARQATRLWLVELYAAALGSGLNLLGIVAPDKL